MKRRSLAIAALLLPLLSAAGSAAAYRVITTDGRTLEASRLAQVGGAFRLETGQGTLQLPAAGIDFYATFRANTEQGNVVAFVPGGFLRFEAVTFSRGRVTLELAEGRSITVQETIIDYRASVLEGSFVTLPAGRTGSASVAKATEGPAPEARRSRRDRTKRSTPTPPRKAAPPRRTGTQTERSR